jgi:hypothetical protein
MGKKGSPLAAHVRKPRHAALPQIGAQAGNAAMRQQSDTKIVFTDTNNAASSYKNAAPSNILHSWATSSVGQDAAPPPHSEESATYAHSLA